MHLNSYIAKPLFVDYLETSYGYFIVLGQGVTFFAPKFFTSRSYLKATWNSLSKLKEFFKTSFMVLYAKGIGFKLYYYRDDHSVYLNLGYNHLCRYILNFFTSVKVRKQYLLLYGLSRLISVNFFKYEISYLRAPDPYRGKGIRGRFDRFKIKPGKQR